MRDRQRPKVGEILVAAGVIDEQQLRAALGEQARWGRPLGATLVKLGFVEEKELVRALASQLGMPMAILDGKRIPPDVLALVPREVAERERVIPLFVRQEGGRRLLFVGVEDPGNLAAFDDLAFRTGMEIKPVMVGPSELFEAIDRCYDRHPECTSNSGQPSVAVVTPGTEELARHWSRPADGPAEPVDIAEPSPPHEPMPAPAATVPEPAREQTPAGRAEAPPDGPGQAPPEWARPAAPSAVAQPGGAVGHEVAPAATPAAPASTPAMDVRSQRILRALAELLIEKGVLTREELQVRVRDLERAAHGGD